MNKNLNFVQWSDPDGIDAINALYVKAPAKTIPQLFMLLIKLMDEGNGVIVSQSIIAAKLNVSRPTIIKAIKYLVEHRYIAVYKSGNCNVYTLNASLVWKEKAYKKYEAELFCKVLLSLDEQDQDIKSSAKKTKQLELV